MRRNCLFVIAVCVVAGIFLSTAAFGADIELAKKSTIESILKRGELRVGFESGYVPFEMMRKG